MSHKHARKWLGPLKKRKRNRLAEMFAQYAGAKCWKTKLLKCWGNIKKANLDLFMSVWHELHLHFHFIADFFCCSVLYPLQFMNVVMLASGNRTLIRLGHHEYTLPELPLDYWKCAGWGTVLLLMTAFSFGRLKYCVAVTLRCDAGH